MEKLSSAMERLLAQWRPIAVPWELSQLGVRHVHANLALDGLEWNHLVNVSICSLVTAFLFTFCPLVTTFFAYDFKLQMTIRGNFVAKKL